MQKSGIDMADEARQNNTICSDRVNFGQIMVDINTWLTLKVLHLWKFT